MPKTVQHQIYDSHPDLPLDPDTDRAAPKQPLHTDTTHIATVAIGAFFGTLARYEIGLLLPTKQDGFPLATLAINLSGAFVLGLLMQTLSGLGKDEGGRRIARLLVGTGFCGAFTTYSSLATSVVLLVRDNHVMTSILYALISVIGGIITAALGIQIAMQYHSPRRSS